MIYWIIEKTNNQKFPYKLSIKGKKRLLLSLFVQDKWPGSKGNIFCLRADKYTDIETIEEIERVPVLLFKPHGKRITVVLDRYINKRCSFLFLKKKYKNREGEYEQIFWQTQKGLKERKPKVKLSSYYYGDIEIIIDISEKYPWKFPNAKIEKLKLPCGDYALKGDDGIIAIIERKTFEDMIHEIGKLKSFHQTLYEISSYKYSALVIEANYSDFLNPDKLKFYTPNFISKAIAEIFSFHPEIQIVFAGNRKLANEWAIRFFESIKGKEIEKSQSPISKKTNIYETNITKGGLYLEARIKISDYIKKEGILEFSFSEIYEKFKEYPEKIIRRVIYKLKKDGLIYPSGRGPKTKWKINHPLFCEPGS